MKVKELIEKLKEMPEDSLVELSVGYNYFEIDSVKKDGEYIILESV